MEDNKHKERDNDFALKQAKIFILIMIPCVPLSLLLYCYNKNTIFLMNALIGLAFIMFWTLKWLLAKNKNKY